VGNEPGEGYIVGTPNALMAAMVWSSLMMYRMLGRLGSNEGSSRGNNKGKLHCGGEGGGSVLGKAWSCALRCARGEGRNGKVGYSGRREL